MDKPAGVSVLGRRSLMVRGTGKGRPNFIMPGVVALCLGACGGEEPPETGPLVLAEGWSPVSEQDDPFWPDDGADSIRPCTTQHWLPEAGGIEVLTQRCNYVTLRQPTLRPVQAGQMLSLQLWWQTLASQEPAEGHIAVWISEQPLFEERVPIPSEADARNIQRQSSAAVPAGTWIYFHVDNHGYNSWTLGSLTVE